jgi:hypothetical protein
MTNPKPSHPATASRLAGPSAQRNGQAVTRGWKRPAAAVLALTIAGSVGVWRTVAASAATSSSIQKSKTTVIYAFGIGPSGDSLIPVPGTTPGVVSEGDEAIINDQLTSTHAIRGGYPIIGYDSGTCTFTRVTPDGQGKGSRFNKVFENCTATAALPNGDITVQGIISSKSGKPQPATLAVTGGTGRYDGAHGSVRVAFGSQFETFTIALQ